MNQIFNELSKVIVKTFPSLSSSFPSSSFSFPSLPSFLPTPSYQTMKTQTKCLCYPTIRNNNNNIPITIFLFSFLFTLSCISPVLSTNPYQTILTQNKSLYDYTFRMKHTVQHLNSLNLVQHLNTITRIHCAPISIIERVVCECGSASC